MTEQIEKITDTIKDAASDRLPARLFLVCGFIGSGKTTTANDIAQKEKALCLTLDEWVNKLYGSNAAKIQDFDPQERVKEVMWQVAVKALKLGTSIVLDWGFWTRKERDGYREKAGKLGIKPIIIFLETSKEQCLARVSERNKNLDERSVIIDLDDFEKWWSHFEPPSDEECGT